MSQPPPQPRPGEPSPGEPHPGEAGSEEGYQPPAAPGPYPPPPGQAAYPPPAPDHGYYPPPPGQGSYPPPPGQGSYPPPPGQGTYAPPGQGSYGPPPGQGSYGPPPGDQGSYQPPASPGSYPPPPPDQGYYPPPAPDQGYYPPPAPDQGYYPPPAAPGAYPPPGADQGAYPPGAGYPGQGAPLYGTGPAPKKKSSALKIVLIVVAVVALLCVGGLVVAFVAFQDKIDATKISVVEPQTLGGRPKASDPSLQGSAAGLNGIMSNVPGATGSVGAIYGDLRSQDIVMVAAASSINGSAQDRFDELSNSTGGASGFTISNLTETEPGPLGGIAKCGDTDSAGVPMAVCIWSDNGSVGLLAMMFKEKAELEREFVTLRGEIEKKS